MQSPDVPTRDELLVAQRAGKQWALRVYRKVSLTIGRDLNLADPTQAEQVAAYYPFFPALNDALPIHAELLRHGKVRQGARIAHTCCTVMLRSAAAAYDDLCISAERAAATPVTPAA